MASVADIVRMHELRMQAQGVFCDLSNHKEKRRTGRTLTDLYFALLRAVAPPLFIEAGARDASVSFRAREVLPHARIVAFEPSPYNVEHYRKELDFDGQRIEYEQLALADAPGELPFYLRTSVDGVEMPLVVGRNSLMKRTAPNTLYEEVKVRAVRLDDYFPAAVAENCCLWIDVEGSSGKVIAGGKRLLGQTQVLMIEVEDRPVWQGQWLATQVLEFLYPLGLVPIARDFEWWPDNYNVVCVREDLIERPDLRLAIDEFYSSIGRRLRQSVQKKPKPNLWQRLRARFA
jgi:FkbM family methyltransferase